jgi:hypothetical protein
VSKKGTHPILQRLITLLDRRLTFTDQVARLRRQRQWLIDLEHLLNPDAQSDQPPSSSKQVAREVNHYLVELLAQVIGKADHVDQKVAIHIEQTFRNLWWGLFVHYDVEGLPRTNNGLERFLRQIKMGQRRISGHKNVHDAIIRYGAYLALVDDDEGLSELLTRLKQTSHADFLRERKALDTTLLREQKQSRFRHHPVIYLNELEERWIAAVELETM